jgi:hypothetical protein
LTASMRERCASTTSAAQCGEPVRWLTIAKSRS